MCSSGLHSSLDVWPTGSNPARCIPVLIDSYPFESLVAVPQLARSDIGECPGCRRLIDSRFFYENERFRCCWCQKTFKSDAELSDAQINLSRFLIRQEIGDRSSHHYHLVFALDPSSPQEHTSVLTICILSAISHLPPDVPFHFVIIYPLFLSYLFVVDGAVVRFDLPQGGGISSKLKLDEMSNFSTDQPILKSFLDSLIFSNSPNDRRGNVDDLIAQLSGDPRLFVRIVLFSTYGPSDCPDQNVFVDWVCPVLDKSRTVPIGGYFLCINGEKQLEAQLGHLIQLITTKPMVFNLEVSAFVTHYKIQSSRSRYATGLPHFCQNFALRPSRALSASAIPSLFGVETKYLRFEDSKVYEETIWVSEYYRKSSDFIPVCSGLDPKIIIPQFEKRKLAAFVADLVRAFRENCSAMLPGAEMDYTFSSMPTLQPFLLYLFAVRDPPDTQPFQIYASAEDRAANFIPRVCYWLDPQHCIASKCRFDVLLYRLLGNPPIALFDMFTEIHVFGISDRNIEPDSALGKSLSDSVRDRFPKPFVRYRSHESVGSVLPSTERVVEEAVQAFGSSPPSGDFPHLAALGLHFGKPTVT
jgi:hypothetical protein